MTRREAHPKTRRMMEIAIWRLNVLEYVILGVAMALALLAGALAAWMVVDVTGAPFRLTWALSSLVFFVGPGWVALRTARTSSAEDIDEDIDEETDDGGR